MQTRCHNAPVVDAGGDRVTEVFVLAKRIDHVTLDHPDGEPLDQNQPAGSVGFFAGNCKFLTRKLWGFYNQGGALMHHGKFTTAREAVEAHNGEARRAAGLRRALYRSAAWAR